MGASRDERERELLDLFLQRPAELRHEYERSLGDPPADDLSDLEIIKQLLQHEFPGESPGE